MSPTRDREAARRAQKFTQRAIRRLDVLEWVFFAIGALLACAGGAAIGWVLEGLGLWDFRSAWIGASLVLFIVSGTVAIMRIRRDEREHLERSSQNREHEDG